MSRPTALSQKPNLQRCAGVGTRDHAKTLLGQTALGGTRLMAQYAPKAADGMDSAQPGSWPGGGGVRSGAVRSGAIVETDIPSRLDALPFGGFHLLVIVALGVTWILDGLEVTLAGSLSGQLTQSSGLGLSNAEIGLAGSAYLSGAGIGGEYTAINSTIQELIPARLRGWIDLLINGSFWVGAAMGAGGSIVLLNSKFIDPALGWRLAFLIGTTIGLFILIMRRWIPE